MTVQMLCPNLRCRKVLAVPVSIRGKIVKCQHCDTLFKVPEEKKLTIGAALANHTKRAS